MIRLRDATTLALTKLRTRKIRLTITIIVSGLLFGGLAGASFAARGVMSSIGSFSKEGFGSRYIAQAYAQTDTSIVNQQSVMDRATAIYKDTIARKKAEAKRLGITYDPATEQPPVQEYDAPNGKQHYLNAEHPAAQQAVKEYQAAHPAAGKDALASLAAPYHPTGIYQSEQIPYTLGGASLQVLKEGKETFAEGPGGKGSSGPPTGVDTFISSWSAMSSTLLEPFTLPGQNLKTGTDGSVPIIVPNSAAEQLLTLKALPASATTAERFARIKEIRAKAPSLRFKVCYRNATSASLVQQAIATSQEIERNKKAKGYQKPSLIYGIPTDACGAVPVTRDIRTKDEKALAAKQLQFDQTFGAEPASQQTIDFRIVGIVPDPNYGGGGPAFGVGQIIQALVTSSLGNGWYMPQDVLAANPLANKLFNEQTTIYSAGTSYYVEFASATQAREFIDKKNCAIDFSKFEANTNPQAVCEKQGKPFGLSPYGSNSLALESAKRNFGKSFRIAGLVVSVIAAVIMMGTVGRMVADSRRETAVFRAIGAKRLDIAQIYIVYTIFLSLLIALFAILAGLALALWANHRWSPEITIQALIAYNAQDLGKTFNLYALYIPDLLLLVGLSVASGLLSSVIPLLRNSRRNPIRDMRDEN